jgi:hypothetical protein
MGIVKLRPGCLRARRQDPPRRTSRAEVRGATKADATCLPLSHFGGCRYSHSDSRWGRVGSTGRDMRPANTGVPLRLATRRTGGGTGCRALRGARCERQCSRGRAFAAGAASLILSLIPGRSPSRRRAAGVCGLGGLAPRLAVFHAGKASTLDPQAAFPQQALW